MFRKLINTCLSSFKEFLLRLTKILKPYAILLPSNLYLLLLFNLVVVLVILARHPAFFFTSLAFKINFVLVLAFHLYFGVNSILKDYVDSPYLRRFFSASLVLFLSYGLFML